MVLVNRIEGPGFCADRVRFEHGRNFFEHGAIGRVHTRYKRDVRFQCRHIATSGGDAFASVSVTINDYGERSDVSLYMSRAQAEELHDRLGAMLVEWTEAEKSVEGDG